MNNRETLRDEAEKLDYRVDHLVFPYDEPSTILIIESLLRSQMISADKMCT